MTEFGVHSEVGKLRKVMVHRPELSLQRLTPSNHDELLFDDVLWVERAQYEHDRFVEKMRERGVEVFLFKDLLATTAQVSEARQQIKELWDNRLSPYAWAAVLLMAFAFIVTTLIGAAEADSSRVAAAVAMASMFAAVDLLWETDTLRAEKAAISKGYTDNMARLELNRRRSKV